MSFYVLVIGYFATPTTSAAPANTPRTAPLTESREICITEPVPSGWVVTHIMGDRGCDGGYRFTIEQPRNGMEVCLTSAAPVPVGWVVTHIMGDGRCNGYKFTIEQPRNGMEVCLTSAAPVPVGWVVVDTIPSGRCNGSELKIMPA